VQAKSSLAGVNFRATGANYFNPDEACLEILAANPGTALAEANAAAWQQGKRLLEQSIARGLSFAFETTLGGNTIPALLYSAAEAGIDVHIWYVGLSSPELHIERVRARVAGGGHDIPEQKIRERYDNSRANLIRLLPKLAELRLYDNSAEADPSTGIAPHPKLILHWAHGKIAHMHEPKSAPDWTKPILAAAIKASLRKRRR
jgi:predicted ABC-type ATPase